ncbi:MAG: hypothetical protein JXK16_06165 [Thiotrichales bacterium]|nr:hypothetical protein [Thiotrichales bacterium]
MKPIKPVIPALFAPSVVYFGIPMGLLGAAMNGLHLQQMLGFEQDVALNNLMLSFILFGWLTFILVGVGFASGLFNKHRDKLKKEWLSHFQISLFPSITLTTFLVIMTSVKIFSLNPTIISLLLILYLSGIIAHTFLNIYLINRWIFAESVPIEHHKPTWFILLSGNFVVVISGLTLIEPLGLQDWHFWPELLWLYFAGGLILWFSFSVSLLYRLIFESKIELNLRPTLFIFMAPPSLATVASILLLEPTLITHPKALVAIPGLTWLLFSFASFMLLLWTLSIRYFMASGLSVASWAYIYPIAAYGMAMQYVAQADNHPFLTSMSLGIFLVLAFLMGLLSLRSLLSAIKS